MHTIAILSSDRRAANNSRYIMTASKAGKLKNAHIGLVVSNNADAAIFNVAEELEIPSYATTKKDYGDITGVEVAMRDLLLKNKVELVLLVGYMPKVSPILLDAFPARILNFHPGPIPRFGGKGMMFTSVQKAVLEAGAECTGPTIHLVDEEYDHGQTLAHWPIKVRPDDTPESLNERCNLAGRKLYVQVINDFIYRLDHPDEF